MEILVKFCAQKNLGLKEEMWDQIQEEVSHKDISSLYLTLPQIREGIPLEGQL